MIILDTNVVSEMMKPQPDSVVRDWLDAQPDETLWLTSVTVSEITCGIELLPNGERKTGLSQHLTPFSRAEMQSILAEWV